MFLLDSWYETNSVLDHELEPPQAGPTWAELHPASLAFAGDPAELRRADEWLALAQTLVRHDPPTLQTLGIRTTTPRHSPA